MSPRQACRTLWDDEGGFTLLELLVSMISLTVLLMAAFAFLQFTTEDVSHITARVGVDQNGRVAMQRIISELHSSCVAPNTVPIQAGSNEKELIFITGTGEKPAIEPVEKHELIFTEPSGTTEGTLVEKAYKSTGGTEGSYTWASTATTTKLLTGVEKTKYGAEQTPMFRYYRYYHAGDTIPAGDSSLPYGELYPTALTSVSSTEAENIVKATVSFTVAPEGKEAVSFNHDRPVALEDSAVFRLAPASETATNLPCSPKT
ncbi:MAG TPA: hypothetical protein VMF09_15780 [Solirubrobacteraceae bacterium]|nr:hypothetical protein [Solirubrobacteraceae bacterium]